MPEKPIPAEQWAEYYHLYHPDETTQLTKEDVPLFRALRGEDVHNVEIVVAPKQSNPHHLMCSGRQLLDSNGHCIGAVIAMHDITEYRRVDANPG